MRLRSIGLLMLIAAAQLSGCATTAHVQAGQNSAGRARAVWERMIEAKGGRQKLHAIETLVVSLDERPSRFDRHPGLVSRHTEKVFALPDRIWEWYDFRDSPARTDLHGDYDVRSWSAQTCGYWLATRGGRARFTSFANDCFLARDYREQLMMYLLETRDFQPVPVSVAAAGLNRVRLRLAAPDFDSVTFLVDTRTYLASEMTVVPLVVETWNGNKVVKGMPMGHLLEGVRDIAGIKMPIKVDGAVATFVANPPVDPELFTIPPDRVVAADAWKSPRTARPPVNSKRFDLVFQDSLLDYFVKIPTGFYGIDVVDQQGFRMQSDATDDVMFMAVRWLPGPLDEAVDVWTKEVLARYPALLLKARTSTKLGPLDAMEVVFEDPAGRGDVNSVRFVLANRKDGKVWAQYCVELEQRSRSAQGEEAFRTVVQSFRFLSR